jgi:prephenate dehydratase
MKDKTDISGYMGSNNEMGIAIQGGEGSFHQVAAQIFFGYETPVNCCNTFGDLIRMASDNKQSLGAVMAIENSIAGSILANYNLLQSSDLVIIGEVYLQIEQNLLVNRGIQLEDIREVHSHPMAIQQCTSYLDKFNWKLVETDDTALSAKHIYQKKSKHIAAIASQLAAGLYHLDVIAPSIQTQKNNYTRFLVLKRSMDNLVVENANKASVNFSTDHSRGSLAKVLSCIADAGINLSKLQSFPIPDSNWLYSFHADMEFDNIEAFHHLIDNLSAVTSQLKIYGIYKSGK